MAIENGLAEGFRRFGLLLQREAAHQVILEALGAADREDLRAYHWDLSIRAVTRAAELAIELQSILGVESPVLALEGNYPPRRARQLRR